MATPLLVLYGSQTGNAQVSCFPSIKKCCTEPHTTCPHACLILNTTCTHVYVPNPQHHMSPMPNLRRAPMHAHLPNTTQDVAEAIAREARLLLFEPRVLAMDAYPVPSLPTEQTAVFVASTTGQVRLVTALLGPQKTQQMVHTKAAQACEAITGY